MLPKIRLFVIQACLLPPPKHASAVIVPVLTPTTSPFDINAHHCAHGHIHGALLRKTAEQTGTILEGMLHECKGSLMAKGLRKPVPRSIHVRAGKKLGRVFVDLSGPKQVESKGRIRYVMVVKDGYSRFMWVYFMRHKSDAAEKLRQFFADNRATRFPSDVEMVKSDYGGEFLEGALGALCRKYNNPNPEIYLCEQSTVQRRSRTGVRVDGSRSFGCKNTSSDTISERRAAFFRLFVDGGHAVDVPYFLLFCNDLQPTQQITA